MASIVVAVDDQPLLEAEPEEVEYVEDGVTFGRLRRQLRVIVEHEAFDLLIVLFTFFSGLCVLLEACIGYGLLGDHWLNSFEKHLHSANLMVLSALIFISFLEIIALGIAVWYHPKHVVQLGIIVALLYMELLQCWQDQICTWGGLAVFLLIPYRINSYGWYASIIADWRENPQTYHEKAEMIVDHPVTHVAVVGLVLADFALIVIEMMVDSEMIGSGSHKDHKLALYSLSQIRLTIYSVFAVEVLMEIYAFGIRPYFSSCSNVVDALTVYLCLIFELVLPKDANDYAQLIMFIRLWRIFRIVYGLSNLQQHMADAKAHAMVTEEDTTISDTAQLAQDKINDIREKASNATGGLTDGVVDTLSSVTGIHTYSEADLAEMNLQFKTLSYLITFGIVGITVIAFCVMFYGTKYADEMPGATP
jgi:hypothetical protein